MSVKPIRVKVVISDTSQNLEDLINNYCEKMYKLNMEVVDIKITSSTTSLNDRIYLKYIALITYC